MTNWRNSWTIYSIAVFTVWALVLLLVWILDTSAQFKSVGLFFCGYFFGWLSATLKIFIINKQSK